LAGDEFVFRECLKLAGSTLSASRSKAAVAKNVVAENGCLLDFLRIHPPGQKLSVRVTEVNGGSSAKAADNQSKGVSPKALSQPSV